MAGGGGGRPRGPWGSNGGGWPGGGPIGFPGGGPVVLGPGGRRGGYGGIDPSHSAGTATIAGDSGGDVMQVDDASSLEDTLARLRQRYALFFYMPEGVQPSSRTAVEVSWSAHAGRRYDMAEVRYRRVFQSGAEAGQAPGPALVTRTHTQSPSVIDDPETPADSKRRSAPVNEDSAGPRVNTITIDSGDSGTDATAGQAPSTTQKTGGWPRATKPPQ